MSVYHTCKKYVGEPVRIIENCGKTHVGIIERVDSNYVYLRPLGGRSGLGGYNWFGFFPGLAFGLALGSIAAVRPFYWW